MAGEDFEDIIPPFYFQSDADSKKRRSSEFVKEQLTQISNRIPPDTEEEYPDEIRSSDVIVIDDSEGSSSQSCKTTSECGSSQSPRVPRQSSRTLRTRASNKNPPKSAEKSSGPMKKPRGRPPGSRKVPVAVESPKTSAPPPKELPRLEGLPSVHDLIDFTGRIGAHICTTHRSLSPPDVRAFKSTTQNFSRGQRRKQLDFPEWEADEIVERSCAVFGRLQARASRADVANAAAFTTRHPFLYSWEKDEDRLGGGQWRERRACYQALLNQVENEAEQNELGESDAENTPPKNAVKDRRASGKRQPRAPNRDFSPTGKESLRRLSALEPVLIGYRWPQGAPPNASPEKILFWR